jgi:preprotein translocase subunit SecD
MKRRPLLTTLLCLAALGAGTAPTMAAPGEPGKGTLRAVLAVGRGTGSGGGGVDLSTSERILQVLNNRINAFGLAGSTITAQSNSRFLVQIPDGSMESLRQLIRPGHLEFRWLKEARTPVNPTGPYEVLMQPPRTAGSRTHFAFRSAQSGEPVPTSTVLQSSPVIVTGSDLLPVSKLELYPSRREPVISIAFSPAGTKAFADFTRDHFGHMLAVVLDGELLTAPRIASPILDGKGILPGEFKTVGEARTMAQLLNSGALPVPLKPVTVERIQAAH